jgi:hypothetical protein
MYKGDNLKATKYFNLNHPEPFSTLNKRGEMNTKVPFHFG